MSVPDTIARADKTTRKETTTGILLRAIYRDCKSRLVSQRRYDGASEICAEKKIIEK